MKKLIVLIVIVISVFAEQEKKLDLLTTEIMYYNYTGSAIGLENSKLSYTLPAVSYIHMDKNYIVLASIKYSKKQNLGYIVLESSRILLEQEGWKYELGVGYKYYLTDKLFIGPALLFSDTYTTLYQTLNTTQTQSETHDVDVRFYGLFGYNITKATMFFGAIELDDDLLSNDYKLDYSQYKLSTTLYQFVSKSFFLYLKYEQSLKDKKARDASSGNQNYTGYGFGFGIRI